MKRRKYSGRKQPYDPDPRAGCPSDPFPCPFPEKLLKVSSFTLQMSWHTTGFYTDPRAGRRYIDFHTTFLE